MKFRNWKDKGKHPKIFQGFNNKHPLSLKNRDGPVVSDSKMDNQNTTGQVFRIPSQKMVGKLPTMREKIITFYFLVSPTQFLRSYWKCALPKWENKPHRGSHGSNSFKGGRESPGWRGCRVWQENMGGGGGGALDGILPEKKSRNWVPHQVENYIQRHLFKTWEI